MTNTGKRILLVEDDRFLHRACETSLRQRGYTVTTAGDGEEGLRLARQERPADARPPGRHHLELLARGGLQEVTRRPPRRLSR